MKARSKSSGSSLASTALAVSRNRFGDELGRPRLAIDEPRVMALLATTYDRPVEPHVLAKLRRACERWTVGDKALAHIHLAHAGLPPCGEGQALRLFVADELIDAGVATAGLLKAQGFDPAPLDVLKANFNPGQLRWPAADGRAAQALIPLGVKEWIARLALAAARRVAQRVPNRLLHRAGQRIGWIAPAGSLAP